MNPIEQYIHDRDEQVKLNMGNKALSDYAELYTRHLVRTNYTKNFTWTGIPIIQYPGDLMVMQELIWQIKPYFIIETGIAFGGMSKFYHDMMRIIWDIGIDVISIDIDIRPHAKELLGKLGATAIKGSSIDRKVVRQVKNYIFGGRDKSTLPCLVSLDSNHTHDHVLQELKLYSPFVSVGSYIVVFDTAIEFYGHLDKNQDRPWGKGNNPWTAVQEFMKDNDEFVVDREMEMRAGITAAPDGWLRRVK